ncbi:MAG: pilus assembly protein N-terminal domain-containing protein [Deltaproteobacteria bacterium]|nr:pilus assembly protein N-terminal domain-containing protein [Deltaproteobacteria bacterium]
MGPAVLWIPGLLLAAHPAGADEDHIPDQVVVVHAQAAVDVPYPYGDVSVGSSEILRVVPLRDSRQLLVAGRRVGSSNVIVYDQRGARKDTFEVVVIPANLSRVMQTVQDLLQDVEGLSFRIIDDRIYVQGEVGLDEDLKRVNALAEREPLVEAMVTLSPVSRRLLADLVTREIDDPDIRVRLIGSQILLEGVVRSEAASRRAEAIARAHYEPVVNVLEIRSGERVTGRAETVGIVVHFVELTKSAVDSWGLEWSPLASDRGVEAWFESPYASTRGFGDITGYAQASLHALLPRLNRARTSGSARVLENPSVSVKSGDTATIFSGDRVPFAVQGPDGQLTVQYEQVGIQLDVTPFAQGEDVDLDIHVEVSSLGETAPSGYPLIGTSILSTSGYCRSGESVVIGGLQRTTDRVEYDRVPDAEGTGALFTLYKSKDYRKSKSQFLVFITPEVHASPTEANRELKETFQLIDVRP